ncbi:MAG: glutamine--fructose-6-phosphate transaminase (isomerizing) [Lachnospiraceae bacterium]|nr:glutamine--fructose-6-phosphate transaminase (isomerizing) [Lachnospiraceae bacterium]
MCGIVGYTGTRQAAEILLGGLGRLEYRGYDSAGLAVLGEDGTTRVVKATGKLQNLIDKTKAGTTVPGLCGIGHTRWATHGEPTEQNAHPHLSGAFQQGVEDYSDCDVIGVHNGIIENHEELRAKLRRHGYELYSQTDTEVAVKLVDYYYKKYKIGPIDAINRMMVRVRGSYALVLMFRDHPGEIYAARKDSPMIIGVSEGETFIASDVPAILNHTRRVYYIENLMSARVLPGEVHFFDLNGDEVGLSAKEITWDAKAAEKGGYEHFMMKEIMEQPDAVRNTFLSVLKDGEIDLTAGGLTEEVMKEIDSVCIVACGSAWHVGVTAQYVLEDLTRIPVRVELASEFRYRRILLSDHALVIAISQSGETADTLEALRIAKKMGARTLGIVNVVGSGIAREADGVLYTKAGPEIAVATTKAFTAQLVMVYALSVKLAEVRGQISRLQYADAIEALKTLPDKVEKVLVRKERIQRIASAYSNMTDAFFIGRGADYAISLEGSLKLKEISYVHSEAYAAGELKHGTISLIEDRTLVIGVLTQKALQEKTMSNMVECKARGAYLVGICFEEDEKEAANLDYVITIPRVDPHFAGILAVLPLQLLGYYVSISKGLDVDKPRNLAKSVTVE